MPRSKKKTLSQKVVSVGSVGMPASVQKLLGNRFVSLLVILIAPLLFAFGLVSLEWENGFPKLSVNRDKAEQVREQVVERAQELRESNAVEGFGEKNSLRVFTSLENKPSGFGGEPASVSGFELRPIESISNFSNKLIGEHNSASPAEPATETQEKKSLLGNGPLSSLRKQFDNRR